MMKPFMLEFWLRMAFVEYSPLHTWEKAMNTASNVATGFRKLESWLCPASRNAFRAQKVETHGKDPINPIRSTLAFIRNRHSQGGSHGK
jgi:hypothetical protein